MIEKVGSDTAIGHIVAMCGISGAVSTTPGRAAVAVDAQLACQHHRGPDAEGRFGAGCGVVAQNRLAVIDLETGDPPLTCEDRTIGAVLNGEIYNFGALRVRLERDGHKLSSRGDTEVIAHLAEDVDAPVSRAGSTECSRSRSGTPASNG